MEPKGKLIPIGGNEARDYDEREGSGKNVDFDNGILADVLREINKEKPRIEVLTIASRKQRRLVKEYRQAFQKLGYEVGFISEDEREKLDSSEILSRLQQSDCVFITGGDQKKVRDLLQGTRFVEILSRRFREEDFIIAGTSAGAMVLADFMIDEGDSEESLLKGITSVQEGIGLLSGAIIDTHFMNRGRFSRLIEAIIIKKDHIGIGLCEDTAIVISNGHEIRPIGSGSVTIIDPLKLKKTNYDKVGNREPVYLENLNIHFLAIGTMYDLREKQFFILEESFAG